MKYKLAIFDFDGTLADSFPFFISVFNDLAARHGFKSISPEEIEALRGYGARQLMAHVGLSAWRFPFVARDFISRMRKNRDSVQPFAGVAYMLAYLSRQGMHLAIVSSNSQDNISQVLGPDTMRLFDAVECGASVFGKASRLRRVLRQSGVNQADAIYIGDQLTDLEAARDAGMAFGAVAWGYGSLASLKSLAPDEVFLTVAEIRRIAGTSCE
ncbi:phosphoglycolate phosphatase [Paucimonas lemoignei]|uniref:Phosphoglycolate phosphatase n=1 Tax=Paucimonas lemoignei TaxID=29443 RepID=A0A4R3HX38_PAULE|nr:HAD hydrolase-like protein [Paucimonas lemoignei]TCS36831.1 phosphoglycolate phosphatase [Paucimonas lemoignei]